MGSKGLGPLAEVQEAAPLGGVRGNAPTVAGGVANKAGPARPRYRFARVTIWVGLTKRSATISNTIIMSM